MSPETSSAGPLEQGKESIFPRRFASPSPSSTRSPLREVASPENTPRPSTRVVYVLSPTKQSRSAHCRREQLGIRSWLKKLRFVQPEDRRPIECRHRHAPVRPRNPRLRPPSSGSAARALPSVRKRSRPHLAKASRLPEQKNSQRLPAINRSVACAQSSIRAAARTVQAGKSAGL